MFSALKDIRFHHSEDRMKMFERSRLLSVPYQYVDNFKTLDPKEFYQLLIGNDWCVVIFSARNINTTSCHQLLIFSVFTFSCIRKSTSMI